MKKSVVFLLALTLILGYAAAQSPAYLLKCDADLH